MFDEMMVIGGESYKGVQVHVHVPDHSDSAARRRLPRVCQKHKDIHWQLHTVPIEDEEHGSDGIMVMVMVLVMAMVMVTVMVLTMAMVIVMVIVMVIMMITKLKYA